MEAIDEADVVYRLELELERREALLRECVEMLRKCKDGLTEMTMGDGDKCYVVCVSPGVVNDACALLAKIKGK